MSSQREVTVVPLRNTENIVGVSEVRKVQLEQIDGPFGYAVNCSIYQIA
jgi:hypothetical protein